MAPLVTWSHEAVFAPGAISATKARDFTSHHLELHHLPYLVEDVKLVVSELVTNAVVHARSDITVVIQEMLFCVKLVVHDQSSQLPTPRTAQVVDMGGRGLQIVDQYSADWGTYLDPDGNKAVWALFATQPA